MSTAAERARTQRNRAAFKQATQQAQHTHTEREHNMSNTQQAAAQPQPAWPVPRGYFHTVWSVTGRGKSATYCALMPHNLGEPGQRVALIARSGAVTLATLGEIHEMGDASSAGNRWTFNRESIAPEQQAANRAAKAQSTASYWQSDAGIATAERAAARNARKQQQSEPASPEPASKQQSPAQPDDVATTVAMLITGGMSPSDAAAVGVAMRAAHSSAQSPAHTADTRATSAQPSAQRTASKQQSPAQPASPEPASDDVAERCDACNRERRGCAEHAGARELIVCPRCAKLDTDTARVRAARHSN